MWALVALQIGLLALLAYRIARHATLLLGGAVVDHRLTTWAAAEFSRGRAAIAVLEALALADRRGRVCRTGIADSTSLMERVEEYAERVSHDAYVLRAITRLASTLMMLAIVLELGWGLTGGSGLMGLQAGFAERTALALALASACAGVGCAVLYMRWAGRLRRWRSATVRQMRDLVRLADDASGVGPAATGRAHRS